MKWDSLPKEKFDIVYADPPWKYNTSKNWQHKGCDYPMVDEFDMQSLPIYNLLKPNGILFLWATGPKLDVAMRCLPKWGLAYQGVAFVWVKTHRTTGELLKPGHGVIPRITKPYTEFVLAACKEVGSKRMRPQDYKVPQVVMAPRREHSRKPNEVRDSIVDLFPSATRLELFAREWNYGWKTWGLEKEKFQH